MEGVWIVFGWDINFYGVVPFANELEARRYADDGSFSKSVRFVEFGTELVYR